MYQEKIVNIEKPDPYAAPQSFETEAFVEVDIAPPLRRIGAYLLNTLFQILAMIPLIIAIASVVRQSQVLDIESPAFWELAIQQNSGLLLLGAVLLIALGIVQAALLTSRGQSLGKMICRLKVVKTDGSDAGFVGAVLLREIVFWVGIAIAGGIISALTGWQDNWLNNLAMLVCLVQLCVGNRRTIQDMLAGTVVIKLPPKY